MGRKSKFTDEQTVLILKESEAVPFRVSIPLRAANPSIAADQRP